MPAAERPPSASAAAGRVDQAASRWPGTSCTARHPRARVVGLRYLLLLRPAMIDERLHGERERTLPRVYARPVGVPPRPVASPAGPRRRGSTTSATRSAPTSRQPGEFAVVRNAIAITPRGGELARQDRPRRVPGGAPPATRAGGAAGAPRGIQATRGRRRGHAPTPCELDPPLLTALMTERRAREAPARAARHHPEAHAAGGARDRGPELLLPPRHQPVPAGRRRAHATSFGSEPHRSATAPSRSSWRGCSSSPTSSTPSCRPASAVVRGRLRKAREILMSLVLERRASKDEILELYLNDVYLGQRGSFAIHGVAEASRIFFGKDVANLSISEAALIAGVDPEPGQPLAVRQPEARGRAPQRRAAGDGRRGVHHRRTTPTRAIREPLQVVARARGQRGAVLRRHGRRSRWPKPFPGVTTQPGAVDVYTTLDLNLQRAALDAVRNGPGQRGRAALAAPQASGAARRRR